MKKHSGRLSQKTLSLIEGNITGIESVNLPGFWSAQKVQSIRHLKAAAIYCS